MYNNARVAHFTCPALAREHSIHTLEHFFSNLLIWNCFFCIINDIFSSEGDSATNENCVAAQETASIAAAQICASRAGDANLPGSRSRKHCNQLKLPWLWSHGLNQKCGSLCSMAVVQSGCQGSWVHRGKAARRQTGMGTEDRMR